MVTDDTTHNSAITHITHRRLITVDEVIRKWAIRSNAAGKWLVATLQMLRVWLYSARSLCWEADKQKYVFTHCQGKENMESNAKTPMFYLKTNWKCIYYIIWNNELMLSLFHFSKQFSLQLYPFLIL